MKNNILFILKSKIKLNIKGKNIKRFIKKLIDQKIELLEIKYLNRNEVNIKIKKEDYKKILDIKTIYEITVIDTYGIIKIKKILNINKILIITLILGLILLKILTNTIFDIQIIHTDSKIREILEKELKERGIKRLKFKKKYEEIEQIKKEILENYKNDLEWIEIENKGTKYIVRVEKRVQKQKQEQNKNRNIVASKSAIIKNIVALNGEKVKNINDYVTKGETVISGEIKLNDEIKKTIPAEGSIYGEVWYETTIDYPFVYSEIKETGKQNTVYTIKFLNKRIELFNFNKYKEKNIKEKKLLKHSLLPIEFVKENQKEVEIIEQIITEEEAVKLGSLKAKSEIEKKLDKDEHIINYKVLDVSATANKVTLKMFFSVYENITSYSEIKPNNIEKK